MKFDLINDEGKKEYWAALAFRHCGEVSPRLMRKLLSQYGSAYAVFCAATANNILSRNLISQSLRLALQSTKWRIFAEKEWRSAKIFCGEIILWTDYRYPLALKRIPDAPAFLYARGNTSLLSVPTLAIVGSRKSQSHIISKVRDLAKELSSCGLCIVSGLAHGIDYAAHVGAMEEQGKSIGILGCGIDVVYPKNHGDMYQRMGENGLLLSEFAPDAVPISQNFPIRNRIISALSEGVLVAEAAMRSGSLITARIALEQHRPVYVLKPDIGEFSQGCQSLVLDGAKVINDALDIITDIAPQLNWEYDAYCKKYDRDTKHPKFEVFPVISELPIKQSSSLDIAISENLMAPPISPATVPLLTPITSMVIVPLLTSITSMATVPLLPPITLSPIIPTPITSPAIVPLLPPLPTLSPLITPLPIIPLPISELEHDKNIHERTKNPQVGDTLESRSIDFGQMAENLMGELREFSLGDLAIPPKKKKNIVPKEKMLNGNDNQKQYKLLQDIWDSLSELEREIFTILAKIGDANPDEILAHLSVEKQNIAALSSQLLMLEVRQLLVRLPGNRYRHGDAKK